MAKKTLITVPTFIPASTPLGNKAVGDIVKLNVGGVAVEFLVVHQGNPDATLYDASCDGTWLLMKDVYEKRVMDSTDNDYENSDIHAYLNNSFVKLFDSGVQSLIKQVKIPYRKGTGASGSAATGASGLSAKIFLLSAYEIGWSSSDGAMSVDGACLSYFNGAAAKDTKRIAYYNGSAQIWFTRTPYTYGSAASSRIWAVMSDGGYSNTGSCTGSYGIRPALILPTTLGVEEDGTVLSTPATEGGETVNLYREATDGFITVNSVYHKIKKGFVTVNGIYRPFMSSGLALSELPEGALVSINESGLPVLFYLAKHDYESGLNGAGRTLMVRKDCHSKMVWNSAGYNTYASSSIDAWLNGDYKGLLDANVQTAIGATTFTYIKGNYNQNTATMSRGVFLLANGDYFGTNVLPIAEILKKAYYGSAAVNHWTRTAYLHEDNEHSQVYVVNASGKQSSSEVKGSSYQRYTRPAFTLPSNAVVNPEPNADGSYTLLV